MERDPRFPDRPDHADFERLSKIVCEQDRVVDENEKTVVEVLGDFIDPGSVLYMAKGRARLAKQRLALLSSHAPDTSVETVLAALWMDAFATGAQWEEQKSDTHEQAATLSTRS